MQQPPNEALPSWRRKVWEATRAAFEALTLEEKAEAARDRAEMRDISKAKRKAKREQARQINRWIVEGLKVGEIAARLGISENALWSRREAWGYPLQQRLGFRRLFVWVSDVDVETLEVLAKEARIDRGRLLERLLSAALSDDGETAKWLLDVQRRGAAA